MTRVFYALLMMFMALPTWAKDIIQVAEKIERNGTKFVTELAAIGLIVASVSFIFGKQDATDKLQKAIIGTIIALCAGGIVATIKAWV